MATRYCKPNQNRSERTRTLDGHSGSKAEYPIVVLRGMRRSTRPWAERVSVWTCCARAARLDTPIQANVLEDAGKDATLGNGGDDFQVADQWGQQVVSAATAPAATGLDPTR
jgi:hypothetical protein